LFLLRLFWPKKESNKAENAIEPKPKRVSCCCVNSLLLFAQLLATKTKTKAATKFPSPDNRYDKHNHSLGKLLSMVFSSFLHFEIPRSSRSICGYLGAIEKCSFRELTFPANNPARG